ncbi:flagellar biosynthetic protein FliR [Caloranaerobacter azorensis DSM 13643]|uniref:Flagellar biosynthetic protein FliR n=2 Tax=Caloranaerobacter azorensis TaxID=116090 RepID=A0A1M5RLV9_9FIRM|nr:flagellar biosynthetic protein FliR [Caloranaerobacter azorensis DSM 13643]
MVNFMVDVIQLIINKYIIFLLVFVRLSGIFIITPIFSRRNVPTIFKIVFTFFLTLIMINIVEFNQSQIDIYHFIIYIIRELFLGIFIGFIMYLFFSSLYLAGKLVDMQLGFSMVNVLDPNSNIQVPITGNFFYILALLTFLVVNGHHVLIKTLLDLFNIIPLGSYVIKASIYKEILTITSNIFIIAFKLSSPILATIFITNVILGILARTMPQMNVFIVGMPLRIAIGIITLILMIPFIITFMCNLYEQIFRVFSFLK